MKRLFAQLALCTVALTACAGSDPAGGNTPAPSTTPPASDAPPPIRASPNPAPPAAVTETGGNTVMAPGATFDLPAQWVREQPSMTMRLAQARIPGDGGDGLLTVFYFGAGSGGGVEANLERWIGQVEAEAGTSPSRETFTVGEYRATWIAVQGTILPSTMGVGPSTPQPGSRMLGAVVEGPGGPWFFKATGPNATLSAQQDAFLGMLRSIRKP